MNLTLTLLPHQAAELQRRATAAGTDLQTFLMNLIAQAESVDEQPVADLPYEHWRVLFREWLQGHRPRNPNLDDSRESIYD